MNGNGARVVRVNGSLVEIESLDRVGLLDLVEVGDLGLAGEVIAVQGTRATAEVHEYTGGLASGAPARSLHRPLSARLGPGLLGGVFDGLLRPLVAAGDLLHPGRTPDHDGRDWELRPAVEAGDTVTPGQVLAVVDERPGFEHRLLVPPGCGGRIAWRASAGRIDAHAPIARIGDVTVPLMQSWPVRRGRPFRDRLTDAAPLATGQRVLDLLYPVARGSTAAVPGGFGTGKTMLLQQIAKWCDADVIVYVGCGERGNEMADVLEDLTRLVDPRSGRLLSERTVLIANTSNMPMMAREASIYTAMTVAEYFRDMGNDVVLIADSTSRWAEAMREFASRSGELPAEEGYPASLASSLAAFYERAGRVETLSGSTGSVTVIASVSPPGGDLTEPVTAHTQRFVRCFWTLDRDLAYARHYPAVSWHGSFSRDADLLARGHVEHGDERWPESRARALTLLADAERLESLVELVGAAALPDRERVILHCARLFREGVLQQSALSDNDAFCGPEKQAALLQMVLEIYDACLELLELGVSSALIEELDMSSAIHARDTAGPNDADAVHEITAGTRNALETLR
ncbi:MAG TPA: V-type ATP synthase subunit A [Acidimicrobiia bacterium]|nr:V-type ATP synthase subunit A [Acidimicrobiia bacterium]